MPSTYQYLKRLVDAGEPVKLVNQIARDPKGGVRWVYTCRIDGTALVCRAKTLRAAVQAVYAEWHRTKQTS